MSYLPPVDQINLARRFGRKYGVDPRLLLAISGHETQWGRVGQGRPSQGGYVLGVGVTDQGLQPRYRGIRTQYLAGAQTLANMGVHGIQDLIAGRAAKWASDPRWEKGVVQSYYALPSAAPGSYGPPLIPPVRRYRYPRQLGRVG